MAAEAVQVLDPTDPPLAGLPLAQLAEIAEQERGLAEEAERSWVRHAIRCGEALQAARDQCPEGTWLDWLAENFKASTSTAYNYLRAYAYRDSLSGEVTAKGVGAALRGLPPVNPSGGNRLPEPIRAAAIELREKGLTAAQIAETLGVSDTTVLTWTNEAYRKRQRARSVERNRLNRKMQAAYEAQQREREIKRAVRKAGRAQQEAYAMAERFQDVIAQAHREATDHSSREAWARAGEHYRKMRDEIVKAVLGS